MDWQKKDAHLSGARCEHILGAADVLTLVRGRDTAMRANADKRQQWLLKKHIKNGTQQGQEPYRDRAHGKMQ